MPLLNYTTTIEAAKTVAEIQIILGLHGARAIMTNYDPQGQVDALSFMVKTPQGEVAFRLPVHPLAVLKTMENHNLTHTKKIPRSLINRTQAVRVAWRIIKDWVEAQMALIETEMARLEQVFLPYAILPDKKTLYEAMADRGFALLMPPKDEKERT